MHLKYAKNLRNAPGTLESYRNTQGISGMHQEYKRNPRNVAGMLGIHRNTQEISGIWQESQEYISNPS